MDLSPVKGTHDVIGREADEFRYIENVLKATAELYAYKEIVPPVL